MKNFLKILLITVFFCILPVANLYALSKEATEAIEAMRARLHLLELNKEEPVSIASSNDEYIPGRELSAVLARIKRERFESEKRFKQNHIKQTQQNKSNEIAVTVKPEVAITEENIIVADDQSTTESATTKKETQVNAVSTKTNETKPKEKLQVSVAPETTEKSSQDDIIIIEAMEADDSEAWSVPINSKTNKTNKEKPVAITQSSKPSNQYVTGQLLEQSIKRIRHSQRRNTPASIELDSALEEYERKLANKKASNSKEVIANANEEIEELFNSSEKPSSVEEIEHLNNDTTETEENKIDDKKFNDYISKYDFKMPENYRIIVE